MLVYLADLRHKTITLTPDAIPLGIGFLATFGAKVVGPEVQFKLFADAKYLLEELQNNKPDVLGLTNYCWNYSLHSRILRYTRSIYPDVLTVMGGPNIPLDHQGEEARLRATSGLDVYVINEGEEPFATILERYLDSDLQKSRLFQAALPSSIFVDPSTRDIVRGAPTLRMRELDDIPSPYLAGTMDQFFDGIFNPMIQTTRGCPFTCTFCVEGVSYMTKVNKFSAARVKDELEYISQRMNIGNALMVSDSNFGMLPEDVETARSIHQIQLRIGWPKYVWATTGKNNKKAILSAIELLGSTIHMGNSVQSMDPEVLANIKRSNIKLETYQALQQEIRARNLDSYGEVIIALPGETRDSFFRGVSQLLDSGIQRVAAYQLMLLEGTELCDKATREKYEFDTKYRLLSRNFGIYADEPVFELEEIVVATNSFSFKDYMECRKLQLVIEIYHREELFKELLWYLNVQQVPISSFINDLLGTIDQAPKEIKSLFADYLLEAQEELFDSPAEAREFLASNYSHLVNDGAGGNLVQKYSAIGWFTCIGPALHYAVQRARLLILGKDEQDADRAKRVDKELDAIEQYLLAKIINITDVADLSAELVVPLEYDIEAWGQNGYAEPLADYQLPLSAPDNGTTAGTKEYRFYVPEERSAYLAELLKAHGTSTQAIGKLLSRVVLQDLRREVAVDHSAA